jgi:alcohol dehydrogenase class IV
VPRGFTWVDGERIVRFGDGVLADAPGLLEQRGFDGYALLTTERAAAEAGPLAEAASDVLHVPAGWVDEVSAELLPRAGDRPLVAVGGGRVVDTAKAIGAARGVPVAAVPTTLSGAEMTGFHRMPRDAEGAPLIRPSIVIADPALMASQPMPDLAASAMNALAHAIEALYVPLANPVSDMAALRSAELISAALATDRPDRRALALGAVLAGYATGSAGYAVHHVLGQTIVRLTGAPHAQTYAALLPLTVRLMVRRADEPLSRLAVALGDGDGDPDMAPGLVGELASRAEVQGLGSLGVERARLPEALDLAMRRPELQNTPQPPGRAELESLLEAAL